MIHRTVRRKRARSGEEGFSLLEVLIAAVLLIVVFFGITQYYVRGRTQLDYEEHRRGATEIAQNRLETIRHDYTYDTLPTLDGTSTSITVTSGSGAALPRKVTYTVFHHVAVDSAFAAGVYQPNATTVKVRVDWPEKVAGSTITRSVTTVTVLARGMP